MVLLPMLSKGALLTVCIAEADVVLVIIIVIVIIVVIERVCGGASVALLPLSLAAFAAVFIAGGASWRRVL